MIAAMAANGLRQGDDGLEIYAMCEVPSNAILAEEFLRVFDGFSIGSNDLTQLALGLDRDSGTVAHLFDERNDAVRWLIARAIAAARRPGKPIGICGQAPSDYPEFAAWLVSEGIDSISLNPDVAVATTVARRSRREHETDGGRREVILRERELASTARHAETSELRRARALASRPCQGVRMSRHATNNCRRVGAPWIRVPSDVADFGMGTRSVYSRKSRWLLEACSRWPSSEGQSFYAC